MVQVTDPTAREHLRETRSTSPSPTTWSPGSCGRTTCGPRNPGQPGKPLRDYQEVLMRRHASRAQ